MDVNGNEQVNAAANMTDTNIDPGVSGGQDTAGVNHVTIRAQHDADTGHINGSEPSPPPAQRSTEQITITFKDMNGFQLAYRLKPTTALGKAMDHFASKAGRPAGHFRFLVDGERVLRHSTVVDLEMMDGDIVEVHTEQIGGHGEVTHGLEQPPPPPSHVSTEPITIAFDDMYGLTLAFKVKPTTPLGTAMDHFVARAHEPADHLRY